MDVMSTLVLAGIGALFSSAMFTMESWKGLNHKRDCIILGVQEGLPLMLEHRRLMLDHDWLPLLIGTILLHIFYGIILLVAPLLLTNEEGAAFIWLFFILFAIFQFFSAYGWASGGRQDYLFMTMTLKQGSPAPAPLFSEVGNRSASPDR